MTAKDRRRVFAIETKDGQHIGNIELRINWVHRCAELGIPIGEKDYWGKGYGTDTVKTLLRFAFELLNLHRVYLQVAEFNTRGIRCYEKCGFVHEGRTRQGRFINGRYWDTLHMGILRDEWNSITAGCKDTCHGSMP